MRILISILITSVYIAFNIGLTLQVHYCEDKASANKEIVFSPLTSNYFTKEDSHTCCESIEETTCCTSSENIEKCCFETQVRIHIEDEQLVSKRLILVPSPDFSIPLNDFISLEYTEDSHNNDVLLHPPPLKKDKQIFLCSLILYG
jgi:hypothetical protein